MLFKVESNARIVVQGFKRAAGQLADPSPALEQLGRRMVFESIPENFRVGGRPEKWPKTRGKEHTMRVSRRLQDSVQYDVSDKVLRIGTNVKYAPQRHFGGTIEATNKLLAVPVELASPSKSRPKHYGDKLKWMPGGKGKGLLVEEISRGRGKKKTTTIKVRFSLLQKVEQPARPFLLFQASDIAYAMRAVALLAMKEAGQ